MSSSSPICAPARVLQSCNISYLHLPIEAFENNWMRSSLMELSYPRSFHDASLKVCCKNPSGSWSLFLCSFSSILANFKCRLRYQYLMYMNVV